MSWRHFPSWRFVGGAAVACVLVLGGVVNFIFVMRIPNGHDAEEASALWRAVEDGHVLPAGADVNWRPGRDQTTLFVYGVRDVETQGRVVDVVRTARKALAAKPVAIEFRTALTTRVLREDPGGTVSVSDHGELLRTEVVR